MLRGLAPKIFNHFSGKYAVNEDAGGSVLITSKGREPQPINANDPGFQRELSAIVELDALVQRVFPGGAADSWRSKGTFMKDLAGAYAQDAMAVAQPEGGLGSYMTPDQQADLFFNVFGVEASAETVKGARDVLILAALLIAHPMAAKRFRLNQIGPIHRLLGERFDELDLFIDTVSLEFGNQRPDLLPDTVASGRTDLTGNPELAEFYELLVNTVFPFGVKHIPNTSQPTTSPRMLEDGYLMETFGGNLDLHSMVESYASDLSARRALRQAGRDVDWIPESLKPFFKQLQTDPELALKRFYALFAFESTRERELPFGYGEALSFLEEVERTAHSMGIPEAQRVRAVAEKMADELMAEIEPHYESAVGGDARAQALFLNGYHTGLFWPLFRLAHYYRVTQQDDKLAQVKGMMPSILGWAQDTHISLQTDHDRLDLPAGVVDTEDGSQEWNSWFMQAAFVRDANKGSIAGFSSLAALYLTFVVEHYGPDEEVLPGQTARDIVEEQFSSGEQALQALSIPDAKDQYSLEYSVPLTGYAFGWQFMRLMALNAVASCEGMPLDLRDRAREAARAHHDAGVEIVKQSLRDNSQNALHWLYFQLHLATLYQ